MAIAQSRAHLHLVSPVDNSVATLEKRRAELLAEVAALANRDFGTPAIAPGEEIEIAADLFEQELFLSIEGNMQEKLREVEAALERVHSGEYGMCEDCGNEINPERLEALPTARRCIEC